MCSYRFEGLNPLTLSIDYKKDGKVCVIYERDLVELRKCYRLIRNGTFISIISILLIEDCKAIKLIIMGYIQ